MNRLTILQEMFELLKDNDEYIFEESETERTQSRFYAGGILSLADKLLKRLDSIENVQAMVDYATGAVVTGTTTDSSDYAATVDYHDYHNTGTPVEQEVFVTGMTTEKAN